MKLQIKSFFAAALLALGVIATPVLAQDTGWYFGVSVGQSKFDVPGVAGVTTLSTEDDDMGWKIYGGYQFNKHLAVEVGYHDFGGFTQSGTPGPFNVQGDVTGVSAAAVGILPLNPSFSLFGKAGLIFLDISSTASGPLVVTAEDGTELLVGVGARYNFNRNVGIQLEWEYFGGDLKTNFLSLGLRYKF